MEVVSGTGSGDFLPGTLVTVSADPPNEGQVFAGWSSSQLGQVANPALANTTVLMPDADLRITATYDDAPEEKVNLEVVNGTGSGAYAAGRSVLIGADVREGQIFDRWIGDVQTVQNVNLPNTQLVVPAQAVGSGLQIIATYKPESEERFSLVQRLSLSGVSTGSMRNVLGQPIDQVSASREQDIIDQRSVRAGREVSLVAPAAPTGFVFDQWVGQTTHVDNVTRPETFVYMPDADVELVAAYRELPEEQTLVVEQGQGSGDYLPGEEVIILAADRISEGLIFERWEGQTAQVSNVNRPLTTLSMPATSVSVRAVYREVSGEQYALEVRDGTVGPERSQLFGVGAVVEISSNPPSGEQRFVSWSGQTGTVEDIFAAETTVYMPASNVTLQAVYADTFLVEAIVEGEGGSVSAETQSQRVVENEPATIQIQPKPGYLVNEVRADTCGAGSLSGLTYTTARVSADCTVTVTFRVGDRPDEIFWSRFQ